MSKISVTPGRLHGRLKLPPSKSHTMRALLFGAMGKGKTLIREPLQKSPDIQCMIAGLEMMGIKITSQEGLITVIGNSGVLLPCDDVIDAGNSGQVLRFLGSFAGLIDAYTVITGDHSIRYSRPASPLLSGLRQLGAFADSAKLDGKAPLMIKGKMRSGDAVISGEDSQPVSGLLMACSFLEGNTTLEVKNPGEKPWIDLTLSWLKRLGGNVTHENHSYYKIDGGLHYDGFEATIPGDFSSAAFPLVATLITPSEVDLENVDMTDVQGDKKIISFLQEMGAEIEMDHEKRKVKIRGGKKLEGGKIDVGEMIDALPILAVLGCFCEKGLEIVGGAIARQKESDRISSISKELKKMGAEIEERRDGVVVKKSRLCGAHLDSHHDHRIAMSLCVAALGAKGDSEIRGSDCIAKSYPHFIHDFQEIHAKLC